MSARVRKSRVVGLDEATEMPASATRRAQLHDLDGIVHVLTCGSVDDGKSTLIGRLLWESHSIPDDQREAVIRAAYAAGTPDQLDFSLLLDGLLAEREQGITIDIVWRYVDTAARRIVVIDSPGHEQYTRNMASGASHADVAVMLIDARHGIKKQTRRHAAILDLMGVKRVVLAVNKMDLVGWSEARFREIEQEFMAAIGALAFVEASAIPVCARMGDNVGTTSGAMPWYTGPTLIAHLETVPTRVSNATKPFRMAVQTVLRDGQDFRGLAGTVASGILRVGDVVADAARGTSARVARIATMDGDLIAAEAGKAVAIQLDTDLDISRGALLAAPGTQPSSTRNIEARLVWLDDSALDMDHGLLLRTTTDLVPVSVFNVRSRLDLETLSFSADTLCRTNDVVTVALETARPVGVDRFAEQRETGSFLIVSPVTGRTLAAGVVLSAASGKQLSKSTPFILTRALLQRGICSDLGKSEREIREFDRRAREIAAILEQAGLTVELEGAALGGAP